MVPLDRLPIYGLLLIFNSNTWPNSAPLDDVRLREVSDLDFDLSRSLNVKSDGATGLARYGFILMFNL